MRALTAVIFGVALVVALTPVTAVSGPFEDGLEAAEGGDFQRALNLWRPLAEQGNAVAQFNLGTMYANGEGVPQDHAEAVKWYRLSAEQDYAAAQNNLGIMYSNGQGVPQGYAEALKWFRLSAEQGHADAQYNLGTMYDNGQGVPQDYVQAHLWFNLAASRLRPGETRDKAIKNRDLVAEHMTPAQIAEAQKLAREWRPVGEGAE